MSALATEIDLEGQLRPGISLLCAEDNDRVVKESAHLLQLLDKWNRAFNLTAVRDPADMVTRHIFDSLAARAFLSGTSILDVGTGAGFPGLPLALAEPRRHFTLLDSAGKKIRFVRHAVGELALSNVVAEHARIESYEPTESFDTVVTRAFSSLSDFVRNCGRLVGMGGRLLAMKGRYPDDEMSALTLPWTVTECTRVEVPGLTAERHMVVIERRDSGTATGQTD